MKLKVLRSYTNLLMNLYNKGVDIIIN